MRMGKALGWLTDDQTSPRPQTEFLLRLHRKSTPKPAANNENEEGSGTMSTLWITASPAAELVSTE